MRLEAFAGLAAVVLVASVVPAVGAANEDFRLNEDSETPHKDLVQEIVEEKHDGEMPDTVEVRLNGGAWQTISSERAMEMILEPAPAASSVEPIAPIPLIDGPVHDAGAAAGPPSDCFPATITSVFSSGGWGADMETTGVSNGGADCLGLPQKGPVSTGSVEITSGGFVEATFTNADPGWVHGGNCVGGIAHCGDWSTADHATAHCTLLLEVSFGWFFLQQLGSGMPGCGAGPATSAVALGH